MKIKVGQWWKDKKTGDLMKIHTHHGDKYWNCIFLRSNKSHKMTEFVIKKYYEPTTE